MLEAKRGLVDAEDRGPNREEGDDDADDPIRSQSGERRASTTRGGLHVAKTLLARERATFAWTSCFELGLVFFVVLEIEVVFVRRKFGFVIVIVVDVCTHGR